jgi:hypothetical protein
MDLWWLEINQVSQQTQWIRRYYYCARINLLLLLRMERQKRRMKSRSRLRSVDFFFKIPKQQQRRTE